MPEPARPGTTPEARALLELSAAAHGLAAFREVGDLSVGYDGTWAPFIHRLQPALVDRGHRQRSEERLLPRAGLVAQAHAGPGGGRKAVVRRPGGDVRVWFDGDEARDGERRAAAALVADGYALFLLGPLLLAGGWGAPRALALEVGGAEDIVVGGRPFACDVLRGRMAPGLGFAGSDRVALFVDREDGLMRRVRFSLDGMESTRGAVAEVDAYDHMLRHDVRWPTRFHERLLRPLRMPVHDWWVTGLDANRGFGADDVDAEAFRGRAVAPAAPLA